MLERRVNLAGRAATAAIPRVSLGGLRVAVLSIEETANFMIEMAFPARRIGRPLFLTSANGEVLARCSTDPVVKRLFTSSDLINADGQPLVSASRFRTATPLPERVATTDLFDVVARKAAAANLTFYMFGASEEENAQAVANVRKKHPTLKIAGRSHGYLDGEALAAKVDEINALAPDILWLALGVPPRTGLCRDLFGATFGRRNDQDIRWIVQLPVGQPQARAAMDAEYRAGVGVADRSGAASVVLALSDDQSARAASAMEEASVERHRFRATLLSRIETAHHVKVPNGDLWGSIIHRWRSRRNGKRHLGRLQRGFGC